MFLKCVVFGILYVLGIHAQLINFSATGGSNPFNALHIWPLAHQLNFNFHDLEPWWKGPNVCIEREESGDQDGGNVTTESAEEDDLFGELPSQFQASLRFSSCFESQNKYECIIKSNIHGEEKTNVVKYKCCHGYIRSSRFGGVCETQEKLFPILDVLENFNVTDFKRLINVIGFDDKLTNENYTLFAPVNNALENITAEVSQMNDVDIVRRDIGDNVKDMISNHMIPGFIDLNDYENEDLLFSENGNSSIRLNYYPTPGGGKLVTANCMRIARANVFAANGLVHIVDDILSSPRGSMGVILADPRISLFNQALDASNLKNMFEENGHYTIFLPTNEAFKKLDDATRNKILSGNTCASTILKHHITPHTVCSAAIISSATVHNENGEILNLDRKLENNIILETKAKLLETDILLNNGVVHFIDTVLLPNIALPINEALVKNNHSKFLKLAEEAGLRDELESMSNITLFIPFDAAFDEPESANYINDIRGDKKKLRELVLFHIAKGKMESTDMDVSQVLETYAEEKTLPLKVYPSVNNLFFKFITPPPLVQCSTFTRWEARACGSVLHEIDRVLIPPSQTLLQILDGDRRLSIFRSILEGTEAEKKLKDPHQNITLIATTNYAFGKYKYNLDDVKANKTLADAILRKHIINKPVCCQQLESGHRVFDRWLPYSDTFSNTPIMKDCNIIAVNGVLHTTNTFI